MIPTILIYFDIYVAHGFVLSYLWYNITNVHYRTLKNLSVFYYLLFLILFNKIYFYYIPKLKKNYLPFPFLIRFFLSILA